MDLITSDERKETSTSISSRAERSLEVPVNLSRAKALQYINTHSEARGGEILGVPEKEASNMLYRLFMKIGATSELPEDSNLARAFLNDFWTDLYLKNNLVPGDIPFGIIISEFTTAMVQGRIERKGNNQAAICGAFNKWISQQDVRNRLYQVRDRAYPEQKPKQVAENATTQPTVADYSDEELLENLENIKKMAGIKTADQMIEELEAEVERRGL